jgi:hypothetical protein
MFDYSLVVQSAVSSFNNVALHSPDFFWSALLCAPIFIATWVFAPQISQRFSIDAKKVANWTIAFIAVWLMTHESFSALRDGVSFGISALTAVCVFAMSLFAGWHIRPLGDLIRVKEKWRRRANYALPIIAALIVGWCALGTWQTALTQFFAALMGFYAGRLMVWRGRKQCDSDKMVLLLISALTFGLVMQPEFFRFGQLGHLTFFHILFLCVALVAIVGAVMLRSVRPVGRLATHNSLGEGRPRDSWHKRLTWLVRASALLGFVLFVLTENALVFAGLALADAVLAFLAIRHRSKSDAVALKSAADDLWIFSLCVFGILTAMPAIVCAAIVLIRAKPGFDARAAIRGLL